MSAEDYVLGPILDECHHITGETTGGVGLLGYDMGGQAALRLAYRHPEKFPIAAAIAPAIDFHLGMRHGHNTGLMANYSIRSGKFLMSLNRRDKKLPPSSMSIRSTGHGTSGLSAAGTTKDGTMVLCV
jgi:S-formylglutathione hydrolase FrmB